MQLKRHGDLVGGDTADLSIQEALLQYTRHVQKPFAITNGADHKIVYANDAFCKLAGSGGDEVLGLTVCEAIRGAAGCELSLILDQSVRDAVDMTDVPVGGVGEYGANFLVCAWPVIAEDGRTGAVGLELAESVGSEPREEFQCRLAERMLLGALRERGLADTAEEARRRAAFLAEASRLMSNSLDQASTLLAFSKLALPALGDWCIIDVLRDDGTPSRLEIYHADPEKEKIARDLVATWAPNAGDPFGAPVVLREARATFADVRTEELPAIAATPENLEKLRALGGGPMLTVPLVARDKLLGAITFIRAGPGLVYEGEDVLLAEDLAARGALALDNARSYDRAVTSKHAAEAANRVKTAFLGAMSHELRTPLTAIGGYIDLMDMGLRGPVTDLQHSDLARVRRSQQHMAVLVTEILDFARAGSGGITYSIQDVECCAAIGRAVDLIEPLFKTKELIFEGISGDPSLVARADPDRVAQILVNLLSNAIKFTPTGGRISAGCAASGSCVHFAVTDSGIGIASEKLEVIFEPFIQLKTTEGNSESGVGLGLAISRDLARAMKGDLTVKSNPGEGARFTLTLPRAPERSDA